MTSLDDQFIHNPARYDIWQACVLVGCKERSGVRFGIAADLSFPASEVKAIKEWTARERWETPEADREDNAIQRFLKVDLSVPGLLGPGGPAPLGLCEAVIRESRAGNAALQDFLDIFHDRFVRLWMEISAGMACDHSLEEDSLPTQCALAISGMLVGGYRNRELAFTSPTPGGENHVALPDAAFLTSPAVWAIQPATEVGLKKLLRDCFDIECAVEQFYGAWVDLPMRHQSRLEDGAGNILGINVIIGKRIFDPQGGIRLSTSQPIGPPFSVLSAIIYSYTECDVFITGIV